MRDAETMKKDRAKEGSGVVSRGTEQKLRAPECLWTAYG
jgi:hypothetical protein